MPDLVADRLPRGRHGLTRTEVAGQQRDRILTALAEAMQLDGYVGTSVADVLRRAGVSRETFYQLFSSKQDCFLAAFDLVSDVLVAQLGAASEGHGTSMERFERSLDAYLGALAAEPAFARLFLVEVYAAGPDAMRRRVAVQGRIADAVAALLGAADEADRFACQMVAAAVGAMVTMPLVDHDPAALVALAGPVTAHVRRLVEGTGFGT